MRVWSLFCLVCLLGMSCLSAQAYRIQFKDAEGTKRVYKTQVGLTGNVTMGTVSSPIDSTMTMTALEQVSTVKNGKSSVTYQVKDGKVSVKLPNLGGEGTPQSIEQQVPDFSMAFERTPLGKISNLHVSGEAGNLMGGPPNELNNQLINPEQGLQFPDKDLQPGDTWSCTTSVPLGGQSKLDVTANYVLVGTKVADNGKTYLQIDVDLLMNVPKLSLNAAGAGDETMNMDMSLTMKGKETVLFDEKAGELYQSSCKLTGDSKMTVPGQNDAGMQMTMSTNIVVTKADK